MPTTRNDKTDLYLIYIIIAGAFFLICSTIFYQQYSSVVVYVVQNLANFLILRISYLVIKKGLLKPTRTWPAAGLGILSITAVSAGLLEVYDLKNPVVSVLNQVLLLFWAPIASSMIIGSIITETVPSQPTQSGTHTSGGTSPSIGDTTADAGA